VKNKIKEIYIAYNFAFKAPPLLLSCECAETGKGLYFSSPPPPHTMPESKDFVAALARVVKDMK
jgi:hypothetical protein